MVALLTSIGIFIVILSFLVIIHEIGHFVAARFFGIKVEEFGIGYPPRATDLFTRWGTVFTLNWLPFGGFVRLAGEDRDLSDKEPSAKEKKTMFFAKPAWQRVIVLVAGAFMNFVFGIVAFSLIFTFRGIPEPKELEQGVMVTGISPDSPAEASDLELGDVIVAIEQNGEFVTIDDSSTFIETIKANAGSEISLKVEHGLGQETKEERIISLYVRTEDEIPQLNGQKDGSIGVMISSVTVDFVKYPWWQMPFRGAATGMQSALDFGYAILVGVGQMFQRLFFSGVIPRDVAGPVGIAREVHQQRIFANGIWDTLNFASIISINLAIVNLLPIPALDGGRIFMLLLEQILGKRYKPVYEQYANMFGFLFLLSLIILITIKDVGVIFSDAGFGLNRVRDLLGV